MRSALAGVAALVLAVPAAGQAETWRLTSLSWEPFAGPALPGQGAAVKALRAGLESVGVTLEIRFAPWQRARSLAREKPAMHGYYPAWPSEVVEGFFASAPVFESPLVLAHTGQGPESWDSLADLKGYRIATVDAYRYPQRFRALAEQGSLTAFATRANRNALQMLQLGRVDAVAMDRHVLRYHVARGPGLAELRGRVEEAGKPLGQKPLVVAFQAGEANRARAQTLKRGLGHVDSAGIVAGYLDSLEAGDG